MPTLRSHGLDVLDLGDMTYKEVNDQIGVRREGGKMDRFEFEKFDRQLVEEVAGVNGVGQRPRYYSLSSLNNPHSFIKDLLATYPASTS
jgi:hypothetical protein